MKEFVEIAEEPGGGGDLGGYRGGFRSGVRQHGVHHEAEEIADGFVFECVVAVSHFQHLLEVYPDDVELFIVQEDNWFAPGFEEAGAFEDVELVVFVKEFLVEEAVVAVLVVGDAGPGVGNGGTGNEEGWAVNEDGVAPGVDLSRAEDESDLVEVTAVVGSFEVTIFADVDVEVGLAFSDISGAEGELDVGAVTVKIG